MMKVPKALSCNVYPKGWMPEHLQGSISTVCDSWCQWRVNAKQEL